MTDYHECCKKTFKEKEAEHDQWDCYDEVRFGDFQVQCTTCLRVWSTFTIWKSSKDDELDDGWWWLDE